MTQPSFPQSVKNDALLPKLLSGELRMPAATKLLGAQV